MNKVYTLIILVVILGALYMMRPSSPPISTNNELYSASAQQAAQQVQPAPVASEQIITSTKNLMHTITLETNKGTIVFETYDADAPNTVQNFITLANKNFYDGVIFHRVIEGFMIQGGDPTGTGRGGPGYKFADELNPSTESYKKGYVRGTVAMANSGPNTNGSQFFIMHKDGPLPNAYTIFGTVISGIEVVDAIAASAVDAGDRPIDKIVINKAVVAEKK